MRRFLIICTCGGQKQRAIGAYQELFPEDNSTPTIIRGKGEVQTLADWYKEKPCYNHLIALSHLKGKFMYYLAIDDTGTILEEYNLDNKRRTA